MKCRITCFSLITALCWTNYNPSGQWRAVRAHRWADILEEKTIDTSDFFQLVTNKLFVDKSLLIEEFLQQSNVSEQKVIRIVRPPGWGKTVNADMIKRFLEIELDESGEPLPERSRKNRQLFLGGELTLGDPDDEGAAERITLEPLQIARSPTRERLGRHPVLQISLKEIIGDDQQELEMNAKTLIKNLFNRYYYLRANLEENSSERQRFDWYCTGQFNMAESFSGSVKFLSELLRRRYRDKVFILVDDYDAPANHMFVNQLNEIRTKNRSTTAEEKTYMETAESPHMRAVLSLLQIIYHNWLLDNADAERVLLTGVFNLQLERHRDRRFNVPSGTAYTLIDDRFSNWYGFRDNELDLLLNGESAPKRETIRRWYGYDFLGRLVYNPWSVTRCLAKKGVLSEYWIKAGLAPALVSELLRSDSMQEEVQKLSDGEIVADDIRPIVEYDCLSGDLTALFFSGYLSLLSYKYRRCSQLQAANTEIRNALEQDTVAWLCKRLDTTCDQFASLARHLTSGNVEQFRKQLRTLVSSFPKLEFSDDQTIWFDGAMKSLSRSFGQLYNVVRHRRPDGKYDKNSIRAWPARSDGDKSDLAVVIKYDAVEDDRDLSGRLKTAQSEFDTNEYDIEAAGHIKRTLKIKLVFCRNLVDLDYRMDPVR